MSRFVRFVVSEAHWCSGHRSGLIQAAEELREKFTAEEERRYQAAYGWFKVNLPVPDRFARSSHAHAHTAALSWFKDSAVECVSRMRDVAAILEAHDVRVEMLRTGRPGYVVYEDAFQVAAEPFADTPT